MRTAPAVTATLTQSIIVPLDGSEFAERALSVARALARRLDAHIVLTTTRWDGDAAQSTAYFEAISKRQADIVTEYALIDEHPAAQAIGRLSRERADGIVCMTTHGGGRLHWAVLGSVAEQAVHKARRPMLLVGRSCENDWRPTRDCLLVCVDGSSVAEPIVPVATRWAQTLDVPVRVASVIHPLDVEGATHPNKALEAIVDGFRAAGVHANDVVLRGSYVAGAIADAARDLPATMIAMNTHSRTGAARLALGSVAMATVGLAPCPVLVVPTR
jgi:nucleotide-binding universal stress UspA family protein